MRRKPWSHVDDPNAVGRRLRGAREQAGLSQRQLAFPGCTAAYISRVESGDRIPSLQLLREIGKRLGVSADWLATGVDLDPSADPLLEAELALRFEEFDEAERLYAAVRDLDDESVRARARGCAGRLALHRGDVGTAIEELEAARASLGDEIVAHPALLDALGKAYASRGDLGAAIEVFEDAVARAADDRLAATRCSLLLASALADSGEFGRAAEVIAGVRPTVDELSDAAALARLYRSQSQARARRGEQEGATQYARRTLHALDLVDDVGYAGRARELLARIDSEQSAAPA